jgi:hypothetical protein
MSMYAAGRAQRDIRLTTILELEGPDLRKNSMIHRRSILI